ncbi:hypothetical protein FRC17_005081 [Serendipita sp. 399]|nr:hypothetical protein FRC17_005081 [Serendipita sp. 399]
MDLFKAAAPTSAEIPARLNGDTLLGAGNDPRRRKFADMSRKGAQESHPYSLKPVLNDNVHSEGYPLPITVHINEASATVTQRALRGDLDSSASITGIPNQFPPHPTEDPNYPAHQDDDSQQTVSPIASPKSSLFSSGSAPYFYPGPHLTQKHHLVPSPLSNSHSEQQSVAPPPQFPQKMLEHSPFSPIETPFGGALPIIEDPEFTSLFQQLEHPPLTSAKDLLLEEDIMQPMSVYLESLNRSQDSDLNALRGTEILSNGAHGTDSYAESTITAQHQPRRQSFVAYAPAFEPLGWSSSSTPYAIDIFQSPPHWTAAASSSMRTGVTRDYTPTSLSSAEQTTAPPFQSLDHFLHFDNSQQSALPAREPFPLDRQPYGPSSSTPTHTPALSIPAPAMSTTHSPMIPISRASFYPRIPPISVRNRASNGTSEKHPMSTQEEPDTKRVKGRRRANSLLYPQTVSSPRSGSPFPSFASTIATNDEEEGSIYTEDLDVPVPLAEEDPDALVYPIGDEASSMKTKHTKIKAATSSTMRSGLRKRKRSSSAEQQPLLNSSAFPCSACSSVLSGGREEATFAEQREATATATAVPPV